MAIDRIIMLFFKPLIKYLEKDLLQKQLIFLN